MKNQLNENNEQDYESSWRKPTISKASSLELPKANGLSKNSSLRYAKRRDSGVAAILNVLTENPTAAPPPDKFDSGIIDNLIPAAFRQCPARCIRLSQKWAANVPYLLLAKSFNAHCERDEENLWCISQ
jgi:hypothetical protein